MGAQIPLRKGRVGEIMPIVPNPNMAVPTYSPNGATFDTAIAKLL